MADRRGVLGVWWILLAMGCAGEALDDRADAAGHPATTAQIDEARTQGLGALLDELAGDGSEFERRGELAAVEAQPAALPLLAQATGTCCAGGDCVCRGGEPTADTLSRNGGFRYASYTSGFRDGPRFGGATIFYPTDAEPPLSGVVMCPGFTATRSSIAAWGPFFASHGIVLMIIDTNTVLDPVPARANALLDALASLKGENTRATSPLRGKLSASRYGLAGWSMGGGGTWLATAAHPELKSAVTLAGHNLTAGGAGGSRGSRVPTLMMNGATDVTLLGGLGQSESAYDAIPSTTPKLLYVMTYEGHFSWGTPRTNGNASGRTMMAWQKTFLEGDTRYKKLLLVRGPSATTYRHNLQ